MIYSGIRVFSDDTGQEYTSRFSFDVHDIITLEQYVYQNSFRISGPKTYVQLSGHDRPIILLESFEYLNDLRKKSQYGNHIDEIHKFEAWQK